MPNLLDLSTSQINRIIAIKEQIEELQSQINSFVDDGEIPTPVASQAPGKRRMSAAARARIGAAQKARWAKVRRGHKASARPAAPVEKKKRKVGAAARARLSAIAKARWAKVKASGKSTL